MFPQFDPVGDSIKRCPFLHALKMTEGESFARGVAEGFSKTEATAEDATPVEKMQNVATNFCLFHGADGVLPLKKSPQVKTTTCRASPVIAQALPTASISLSGFWVG